MALRFIAGTAPVVVSYYDGARAYCCPRWKYSGRRGQRVHLCLYVSSSVSLSVCPSVCRLKKRFELSVEIQFMAGPRHAPTLRSKGQDQDLCYDYRLRWITAGMSIRLHYLKLFSVSYLQRRTTVCSMRALVYLLTVVLSGCVVLQGGPSLVDGCP